MTGSVIKGTEYCLCRGGSGVFRLGKIRRVVFRESEPCVSSVELVCC